MAITWKDEPVVWKNKTKESIYCVGQFFFLKSFSIYLFSVDKANSPRVAIRSLPVGKGLGGWLLDTLDRLRSNFNFPLNDSRIFFILREGAFSVG